MRIPWTLPILLAAALAPAGFLRADQAADRKAIEDVVEQLNFSEERASVFAAGSDAQAELHRLERAGCNLIGSVWSELPSPRFTRPSVQFITADAALADLEFVRHNPIAPPLHTPIVAILRRERGEWKIVTLRAMADCSGPPRILPAGR